MPSSAPFRPLPLVLCAAVAVFVAAAVLSTRAAPDTYPVADTATTSIATLQAARGDLAVGSYSRYGWNHPGPLLYQILAGPYELSGRREIALKWAALALNLAWLGGLLAIVGRRAPGLAVAVALALVPLLWREQRLLFSSWNPFVTVLALACGVAAAADLATGRAWRTRVGLTCLVVPLSFCIQAHAGLVVPSAVCVLVAACGLARRATPGDEQTWPAIRSGLLIAAAVAAALWLTPLVAELRQQPNLTSMVEFLVRGSQPRDTWARAVAGAAYMTLGPFLPSWVVLYDEVPHDTPAWLPWTFALLVVAVAVAAVRAHRQGRVRRRGVRRGLRGDLDRRRRRRARRGRSAQRLPAVVGDGHRRPRRRRRGRGAAPGDHSRPIRDVRARRGTRRRLCDRLEHGWWRAPRRQARRTGARHDGPRAGDGSAGLLRSHRRRSPAALLRGRHGVAGGHGTRAAVRQDRSADRGRGRHALSGRSRVRPDRPRRRDLPADADHGCRAPRRRRPHRNGSRREARIGSCGCAPGQNRNGGTPRCPSPSAMPCAPSAATGGPRCSPPGCSP